MRLQNAPSNRSNDAWLAGVSGDDAEAHRVQADLCAYIRAGLGRAMGHALDDDALDDVAQDALAKIVSRVDQFRGDSRFTTWAMAVAIRTAYSALRKRRWGDRSLDDAIGASPTAASPAETSVRGDLMSELRAAIERELTPRQRTAVLGELAGMPTEFLAAELGSTPNALYKLHHDARRRLRAVLEALGFTAEDLRRLG